MERTLSSAISEGYGSLSDDDIFEITQLLTVRCSLQTMRCIKSILTYGLGSLKPCGLFSRIHFDETAKRWSYCAGQSYREEIRTLRKLILEG